MKLLLYGPKPHHKNFAAIQRMCKSKNIAFEMTERSERIKYGDYHILLSCFQYIPVEQVPAHVKIIFGPQFFVFPSGAITAAQNDTYSERCVYNVLSQWNYDVFQEFSNHFLFPLVQFPFGVDVETFQPKMGVEKVYDCLVYVKRRSQELVNYTTNLLQTMGFTYTVFKYGSYDERHYIDTLHKSKCMITIDAHESQGFALEEAMACGVPLVVMDATTMYEEKDNGVHSTYEYLRPKNLHATSVPYWSDLCGIKITKQEELANAIEKMLASYQTFTPRQYILQELSDSACMQRILDYFHL